MQDVVERLLKIRKTLEEKKLLLENREQTDQIASGDDGQVLLNF